MRGRRESPRGTSNTVLAALGIFLLAFITVMTVTFWRFRAVPDTLIQYTLGAGGLEALVLAGIKVSKVIAGETGGDGRDPSERGREHETR